MTAEVSHWQEGGSQVWEVRDDGPGLHDPPPATRRRRPTSRSGGACGWPAAWPTRPSCDPTVPGTAIRLYFREH